MKKRPFKNIQGGIVDYPLPPCIMGGVQVPALLGTTHAVRQGSQQGCHSNGIRPQIHKSRGDRVVCIYVWSLSHYTYRHGPGTNPEATELGVSMYGPYRIIPTDMVLVQIQRRQSWVYLCMVLIALYLQTWSWYKSRGDRVVCIYVWSLSHYTYRHGPGTNPEATELCVSMYGPYRIIPIDMVLVQMQRRQLCVSMYGPYRIIPTDMVLVQIQRRQSCVYLCMVLIALYLQTWSWYKSRGDRVVCIYVWSLSHYTYRHGPGTNPEATELCVSMYGPYRIIPTDMVLVQIQRRQSCVYLCMVLIALYLQTWSWYKSRGDRVVCIYVWSLSHYTYRHGPGTNPEATELCVSMYGPYRIIPTDMVLVQIQRRQSCVYLCMVLIALYLQTWSWYKSRGDRVVCIYVWSLSHYTYRHGPAKQVTY